MNPSGELRQVDAVTVPVPTLDAGLAFYRDQLGHRLLWRDDERSQAGLALPAGDSELVLTTEHAYEPNWLVADLDDCLTVFTAHGGVVISAAADIPVGRVAVVADPFGNPLVLVELSKGRYQTDDDARVVGVRSMPHPRT